MDNALGLPHVSQGNRDHVLIFCSRGFWDIWGMVVDSMASCSSFLPVEDASSYRLMQWLIFGTREEPSLLVAECRGQKIHEYSSRRCTKDLKMKMQRSEDGVTWGTESWSLTCPHNEIFAFQASNQSKCKWSRKQFRRGTSNIDTKVVFELGDELIFNNLDSSGELIEQSNQED